MAKLIKQTPVLKGEDAIRFLEAAENVVPVSEEKKKRIKETYEAIRKNNPDLFR